jgi:hypothetical protein
MSFSFDRKLQYTVSGKAPCQIKKLLMIPNIFQNAEDQDTQNSSTLLCFDFPIYPTEYRKVTES